MPLQDLYALASILIVPNQNYFCHVIKIKPLSKLLDSNVQNRTYSDINNIINYSTTMHRMYLNLLFKATIKLASMELNCVWDTEA